MVRRICGPDGALLAPRALERLEAACRETGHELRIDETVREALAVQHDAQERKRRIDRLLPDGIESPRFAQLVRTKLPPYQRSGALFAARAGRVLLADEMGLGKTVQAIAARAILARVKLVQRTLVVCPASLVHQWGDEIFRFTGEKPLPIAGPADERARRWADGSANLKICTYDAVHRDLAHLRAWDPDLLILDEAQRIKNWPTRAAQAVKRIEAEHCIVLTGTPLENKLEELHSLVEVVDRHLLGPLFRFKHRHEERDADGRVIGYCDLGRIGETLKGVMLRRTKSEVAKQLPGRSDRTLFVPLGEEQRRHHQDNAEMVGRIVQKWRRFGFLAEEDQRRLTAALQRMRMVCDSTFLLDPFLDEGAKVGEIITVLEEFFAETPDGKVVLFSAWLKMHELIARALAQRGWGHVLFHGSVLTAERGALVHRFRDEPACRVFLATDAGGVGLNLQFASLVINADLPWNPAVLEQRIGRVHRLGQTRQVQVVNLVAENSIESGILTTLAFKKALAAGILDGGENAVHLGGTRLKRFMEQVAKVTAPSGYPANTDLEETPAVASASPAVEAVPAATSAPARPHETAGAQSPAPGTTQTAPPPATTTKSPAHATAEILAGAGAAMSGLSRLFAAAEIRRDDAGHDYLHLPLPDPARLEALKQALKALEAIG